MMAPKAIAGQHKWQALLYYQLHMRAVQSHLRSAWLRQHMKWVMPWELFLIHRQSTRNAFQFKLRVFGCNELP